MAEYLSEQEQVDRIKGLVKTHGSSVLTGIMLALTAYFGFQWWQNQQVVSQVEASNAFQQIEQNYSGLSASSDQGEKTTFYANVKKLVDANPKSVYALNALLLQAQQQVTDKKLPEAEKSLIQAAAMDIDDAGLQSVARLRLSQVQLSQNKSKAALDTLAKVTVPAFIPSKEELMGDAYVQLKDTEKAKASYQAAWKALTERQEPRPILRLKMEELGLKPDAIEAPSVLKEAA